MAGGNRNYRPDNSRADLVFTASSNMALAIGMLLLALGLVAASQYTNGIISRQQPEAYSREIFVRRVFHGSK